MEAAGATFIARLVSREGRREGLVSCCPLAEDPTTGRAEK
jgi:hypothetical protein